MDNDFTGFGIMLGFWVAGNQLIDAFTLKHGYLEFSSMWFGVVAVLIVGLCIALYRKIRS